MGGPGVVSSSRLLVSIASMTVAISGRQQPQAVLLPLLAVFSSAGAVASSFLPEVTAECEVGSVSGAVAVEDRLDDAAHDEDGVRLAR
eukprot:SAG22_NODE_797_length_7135_cov_211.841103_6_plen_88_part_00